MSAEKAIDQLLTTEDDAGAILRYYYFDRKRLSEEEVEIAYRIPGKGGFKRKSFKSKDAAEKFVDKLIDKEGKDVEVRWRD